MAKGNLINIVQNKNWLLAPSTQGGWMGPRAGLDAVAKRKEIHVPAVVGFEPRSSSLYTIKRVAKTYGNNI
jgi:hypothetical protein